MSRAEIETKVMNGDYDQQYGEYIMAMCAGDRVIANGDMLTEAMEEGYLFDQFVDIVMAKGL